MRAIQVLPHIYKRMGSDLAVYASAVVEGLTLAVSDQRRIVAHHALQGLLELMRSDSPQHIFDLLRKHAFPHPQAAIRKAVLFTYIHMVSTRSLSLSFIMSHIYTYLPLFNYLRCVNLGRTASDWIGPH